MSLEASVLPAVSHQVSLTQDLEVLQKGGRWMLGTWTPLNLLEIITFLTLPNPQLLSAGSFFHPPTQQKPQVLPRGIYTPGGREGKVQAPISLKMLLKSRTRSSKPKLSWKRIPPPGLKLKPKPNSSGGWGPSNLELPRPHVAPSSSSSSSSSSRVIPPKKGSLWLGVEADRPPRFQHYLNHKVS